ncbi:MAG: hypothetical protein JKY67_10830 [Pseudomonadales bacterium]|nr:hypothetical protein [Pseudomonadales bacterium]
MPELMFKLIHIVPDLWKYIAIALVFAMTLAFCNWLVIRLTFYPKRFFGLFKFLGWQGLMHRRVEKVSKVFSENIILSQISMHEMIEIIEPEMLVNQIERVLRPHLDEYVDEIMEKESHLVWENLPFVVKNRIYAHCHRHFKKVIDNIVEGMANEITYLFDLNHLITKLFKDDPDLLNLFFLESGRSLYRFLIRWAMFIALIMGCIPAILMYYTPEKWILPVLGCFIGVMTNMLVVKLINGPKKEIRIGPLAVSGALARFRHEISESFSDLLSTRVLTAPNIINNAFHGPKQKRTRQLVRKHLHPIIDSTMIKTFSQLSTGASGFVNLKNIATDKAMAIASYPFEDREFNDNRAREIKAHFKKQLDNCDGQTLFDLVSPIIDQSKRWLVISGGLLGGIMGYFVFVAFFQLL